MKHSKLLPLFLAIMLLSSCARHSVKIRIEAIVPPESGQVTIAGNLPELGSWDASEVPMSADSSGRYIFEFYTTAGTELEFKLTRGAWKTEALNADSTVPANTSLTARGDTTLAITVFQWKDWVDDGKQRVTGTVVSHDSLYSPQLDNYRPIDVWLPPSYATDSRRSYPVLYMHDGQNIFTPGNSLSGGEWEVDETCTRLIEEGFMEEIIVVGIWNTADRTAEYSPAQRGRLYSNFLTETVKPFIDSTYRTLPGPDHTATIGSSMGGIISFHLAWEYPQVFSMAGCLSPAFLVDQDEIVKRVKKYRGSRKQLKFYLDNGSEDLEARLQPAIGRMVQILEKKGYSTPENYLYFIDNGAYHSEKAWARRVEKPLLYFFGN